MIHFKQIYMYVSKILTKEMRDNHIAILCHQYVSQRNLLIILVSLGCQEQVMSIVGRIFKVERFFADILAWTLGKKTMLSEVEISSLVFIFS